MEQKGRRRIIVMGHCYFRLYGLIFLLLCSLSLHAQQLRTLYYRDSTRAMEGRWQYINHSVLPARFNDIYYQVTGENILGRPILPVPDYRQDLDKDNLYFLGLYCEGPVKIWYPNGRLKSVTTFVHGIPEGPYQLNYPGGTVALQGNLSDGMPIGDWTSYYEQGQACFTGTYLPYSQDELQLRAPGARSGTTDLPPDDSMNIESTNEAMETYRIRHRFDAYQCGMASKRNGIFTFYRKDGRKEAQLSYSNNIRNGDWQLWNDSSQLRLHLVYRNGRLQQITDSTGTYTVALYTRKKLRARAGQHGEGIVPPEPPEIFTYVEQAPEFQGSVERYVRQHIRYPRKMSRYLDSTAVVQFYIEGDGQISNISILKSAYPPLDKEIVRVLSTMPRWRPGKQQGRPIRVYRKLSIRFGLVVD